MSAPIYRELQKRLDCYSIGFPATQSGVELKILEKLFTIKDATLFLAMSPKLESPQAVAERLNQPVEQVACDLEDMTDRGLLFRRKQGQSLSYGAIPFVHGLFEFQVKRLDCELAGLLEQYHKEKFESAFVQSAGGFLRTIPVGQSIDVAHQVAAFDDARQILNQMNLIVVTDCICRKAKGMVEETCEKPLEVCFMFGSMAQYYLDHDMGRKIEVKEALEILKKSQDAGLVTQPATAQNPAGMCNCCGDCCGVLRSVNAHPQPASIVFSNHYVSVDTTECNGCQTCLDRCQMNAIAMDSDELAQIDLNRCIGCGLCVTTCPTGALTLLVKPEQQRKTPPRTSAEQMLNMARQRGVI